MPLSLSLWLLNNNHDLAQSNEIGSTHTLFPGHNLGTTNFKMLYGTRQLLAKSTAITYEQIPGVKTLLDRHNLSTNDNPIDDIRYLQFIQKIVSGLRFIINSHGYKRIIAYNSDGVNSNNALNDNNMFITTPENILNPQFDPFNVTFDITPYTQSIVPNTILPNIVINTPNGIFGYMDRPAYNTSLNNSKSYNYLFNHDDKIWLTEKDSQLIIKDSDNTNTIINNKYPLQYSSIDLKNNLVYSIKMGSIIGNTDLKNYKTPTKEFILQIIEDSFQSNSIQKILSTFMEQMTGKISRSSERLRILIDSNINPINVHALMQDIPLANIYNYEYTFESMAKSMFGLAKIEQNYMDSFLNKHTKNELLRLLQNPFDYAKLTDNRLNILLQSDNPIYKIFIGDASLGMGRPKFLSDQLYNKCLLQNIYLTESITNSRGPGGQFLPLPANTDILSYIIPDNLQTNLTEHQFPDDYSNYLTYIGQSRFNTHIVRNMFFISNILRIVRLQLNREFTQNRNILKSSHFAISPEITEYDINDSNVTFESKFRNVSQFNDTIE